MTEFAKGVSELVHNVAISAAMERMKPLVGMIERTKRLYGKTMALEAIGVDDNPFQEGVGPDSWRDLSEAWLKKKQNSSIANFRAQQFYRGLTGEMGREIQALNTERIFGETTISAKTEIVQSDGFFNPRINRRIDTVFRDTGGRFARGADFEKKQVRLTVKPFPNLQSKGRALSGFLPLVDEKTRQKLKKNDSLRPLVGPFTQWFFVNKIEGVTRNFLRNLK